MKVAEPAAGAVHTGVFAWPFNPDNAAAVAGWGFWLAILGMILTIGGFFITYLQLIKTRSAADAAKAEAFRIQRSLDRYEIVNEATRAENALTTARNYLRQEMWVQVADSYEVVLDSLEALKGSSDILSDDHKQRIENACDYIRRLCKRIENNQSKPQATINAAKTVSIMREHKALISDIGRTVERGILYDRQ